MGLYLDHLTPQQIPAFSRASSQGSTSAPTGSVPAVDPAIARAQTEWDKKDKYTYHLIKQNVQDVMLGQLNMIKTSKAAWDMFAALYESKNTSRI